MYPELEKEWDIIFIGTGLTEEILCSAIALEKHGDLRILNLDRNGSFGTNRQTFNIKEFLTWAERNADIKINKISEVLGENYRNSDIYMDIMPQIMYAYDDILTFLINTNFTTAITVRSIDSLFYPDVNGQFAELPSSKSAIFKSSSLSLKQKRTTMKFIRAFIDKKEYGPNEENTEIQKYIEEYKDKPFLELLDKVGFDSFLKDAFQYFIAGAFQPLNTEAATKKIKRFTKSIGRYSESPFIMTDYGSGDLPQVFARMASIYGTTFHINSVPKVIKKTDTNEYIIELDGDSALTAKHVICSCDQFDSEKKILLARRVIIVSTVPLVDGHISTLMIPPGWCDNIDPVWIVQLDYWSQCVKQGSYILHFMSMGDLASTVEKVKAKKQEFADSIYFETWFDLKESVLEEVEGVHYVRSPTLEEGLLGTDFFTNRARELFEKMFPGSPFFPEQTEVEVCV